MGYMVKRGMRGFEVGEKVARAYRCTADVQIYSMQALTGVCGKMQCSINDIG